MTLHLRLPRENRRRRDDIEMSAFVWPPLIKIGSQQWELSFVRILASEIYAATLDFADSMICGIGEYGVQRQFPCVLTSEYDPARSGA